LNCDSGEFRDLSGEPGTFHGTIGAAIATLIAHADVAILPAHTGTGTREHEVKTKNRPAALAVALLTLASAVFANALLADFQFDDFQDVVDNRMATFDGLLAAPHHTVRPLLKLSYALNGALAGVQPLAFHAVNIGLHLGSVLLVFLLVRRAAGLLRMDETGAMRLAFTATALWAVHPAPTSRGALPVCRRC
jgi:hypothetical protein